jgi:hypothetical protein
MDEETVKYLLKTHPSSVAGKKNIIRADYFGTQGVLHSSLIQWNLNTLSHIHVKALA